MIFSLFKIILLGMLYSIYTKAKNAILPASTWGILSIFMPGYLNKTMGINIFISASIAFIVAYGVFALARHLYTSMWELPVIVLGIVLLWII